MLIYKRSDKTDRNNFGGISLLSITYKILSNILLSRLTPYGEEITGDHRCGFRLITYTAAGRPDHNTKVKPEAATAVIELLMMGGKTPETC